MTTARLKPRPDLSRGSVPIGAEVELVYDLLAHSLLKGRRGRAKGCYDGPSGPMALVQFGDQIDDLDVPVKCAFLKILQ